MGLQDWQVPRHQMNDAHNEALWDQVLDLSVLLGPIFLLIINLCQILSITDKMREEIGVLAIVPLTVPPEMPGEVAVLTTLAELPVANLRRCNLEDQEVLWDHGLLEVPRVHLVLTILPFLKIPRILSTILRRR